MEELNALYVRLSRRVEGKTPFKCFWDDIKLGVNYTPSIKYLRILGYPVFILINKEKRVQSYKVAPRAEKGILVGFKGDSIDTLSQNQDVEVTSTTTPDIGIVSEDEVDSIDSTDTESTVEDEVLVLEVDIPEQITI
ncbi:uncharacterized protein RAG0_08414 [Rhynchosporium agropyri]|uniref:Uncharacterized protein n=1 Tax=Rhynchosporium agropyri TaxID=914238 RepID=A0A1E1KQR6_9HELO|nr:uncharacterized protein RAG0_08414 [Rhynchosporium agropyri]